MCHMRTAVSCNIHQVDLNRHTAVQWWMQAHLVRDSIYWRVVERGEGSKNCAEALALSSSPSNWMEPRGRRQNTKKAPRPPPNFLNFLVFLPSAWTQKSRRVRSD